MPQLDPTWFASQLFWLAITFVGLYFVLSRLVLPPLQDIIARRQQAVAGDIEQAQNLKAQAEAARLEYERMMLEARERAQAVITDAVAQGKAAAEQASRNLERDIEKKLSEATQKIEATKQQLIDGLSASTAELTEMIVTKLTQTEPNKDKVKAVLGALSKSGNR